MVADGIQGSTHGTMTQGNCAYFSGREHLRVWKTQWFYWHEHRMLHLPYMSYPKWGTGNYATLACGSVLQMNNIKLNC